LLLLGQQVRSQSRTGAVSGGVQSAAAADCVERPLPPTSVAATASNWFAVVTWTPSAGSPSSYLIEAGSSPGQSDISVNETGTPATSWKTPAPPGNYYVRVRARNKCGVSEPSSEIMVVNEPYQDHPEIVVTPRTADRNTYFPSVAKLEAGQLLVVYYDSPEHVSPAGRISLVGSRDAGRTWSAPRVIVDTPLDDRDPSITVTRTGRLLVSYFVRHPDGTGGGVFVVRSDDGGVEWSRPVRVDTGLVGPSTSARILELANGDLLIPIYGVTKDSANERATIVRSRDGGHTWSGQTEVEIAATPGINFQEPALVEVEGRLLAVMRTDSTGNRAYETTSIDGGTTWSEPAAIGLAAQASDLIALPPLDEPAGSVVHAWADWSRRYGDSRPTVVQRIRWPAGSSRPVFGEPRVLYNSQCDDAGYPSGVVLDDGRLFVVFYDACLGYIGGAYLPVSALR